MKKIAILVFLLSSLAARGSTYYACSTGSVNGSIWYTSNACTTPTTLPTLANGDILEANTFTVTLNVAVGSAGVQVTLQNTAGGHFAYAAASALTFYVNATCTTSTTSLPVLQTSGSTGGGTFNGTFTGGTVSGCYGFQNGSTVINLTVTNCTGGSNGSAYGCFNVSSSTTTITGLAQPGSAGWGALANNTGAMILTGNVCGSNTVAAVYGCGGGGAGGCSMHGAVLWNGIKSPAVNASGGTYYAMTASTSYIVFPVDSSYTLGTLDSHAVAFPVNPGITNVKSGTAYGPFTGTYGGACTAAVSTSCW